MSAPAKSADHRAPDADVYSKASWSKNKASATWPSPIQTPRSHRSVPLHFLDVMHHAVEQPLAVHLLLATMAEPTESFGSRDVAMAKPTITDNTGT
jgi:hypothetical protein